MLNAVSIVHPSVTPSVDGAAVCGDPGGLTVHLIAPAGSPSGVNTHLLPLAGGRKRLARYRGLRGILRTLQPDILHVQSDPSSVLALQVALLRRRYHPASALIIECGHDAALRPFWPFSRIQRFALAAADAAIARHYVGLRLLAQTGFSGNGFIIAPRITATCLQARPAKQPEQAVPQQGFGLVVGFAGTLEADFGIVDVLEGVAACRPPIALVLPGQGSLRDEVEDRAASLGIAGRVHMLDEPGGVDGVAAAMLANIDVLIALPRPRWADRMPFDRAIAAAQSRGIPVIASDIESLAEMVGDGGWRVPPSDPTRLACLLQRIAANPAELDRVGMATRREAAARCGEATVQAELRRAFQSACAMRPIAAARPSRMRAAATPLQSLDT